MSEDLRSSDSLSFSDSAGISAETIAKLRRLRDARGWGAKHNPKDLAVSISIEAAELLEVFQWSGADLECAEKREAAAGELADVLAYALMLADRFGLSPDRILSEKLDRLEVKYPVEQCLADPTLAHYEAMKAAAREAAAEQEELSAQERARRERLALFSAPELERILGFSEPVLHHAEKPIGKWTSASDGRVFFVAYERSAVDFWQAVDLWCAKFPEGAALELPAEFPLRPERAQIESLSLEETAGFLRRIVREERMHDGAFLSAAESGVLAAALEHLDELVRCERAS